MSTTPVNSLLSVPSVEPYYENYAEAVQAIQDNQVNSNSVSNSLSELNQYLDQAQERRVTKLLDVRIPAPASTPHDPYTEVRVGTVWMKVPPSHIRISDMRFNDNIPGLRSSANSLIKTGRGRIMIDMMIDFPDEDAINTQLRTLIAQFRTTPFLPIESQYVYNGILAAAAQLDPKVLDNIRLKVDRAWRDYARTKDQIIDLVLASPVLVDHAVNGKYKLENITVADFREKLQGMFPDQLMDEVKGLMNTQGTPNTYSSYVDNTGLRTVALGRRDALLSQPTAFRQWAKVEELAGSANSALDDIRTQYGELAKLGVPEASRRPITPAVGVNMEISTIPGESQGLRVKLSLIYFAYGAYVGKLAYKNAQGYPTPDLAESPYFEAYVQRRFLGGEASDGINDDQLPNGQQYLGKFSYKNASEWVFKYPVPRFDLVTDDKPAREDLIPDIKAHSIGGGRAYNIAANKGNDKKPSWRARTESFSILSDDDVVIPDQAVLRIQNRLAIQPIQNSMYGTVQHLGAINANISVAFNVVGNNREQHDLGVAQFQRMKLETERVALIGGPKVRRSSRIRVNNGLLSLIGVRYAQIDNVTVHNNPGETWSSTVRLDLTEYTISQKKREAIRLQRSGRDGHLDYASLEFGIVTADAYLRDQLAARPGDIVVGDDASGLYCMSALYGGTTKAYSNAILTPDLVTYVLMNRPDVVQLLINYLKKADAGKQPTNLTGFDHPELANGPTGSRKRIFEEVNTKIPYGGDDPDLIRALGRRYSRSRPERNIDTETIRKALPGLIQRECQRLAREMLEFWSVFKPSTARNGLEADLVPQTIRDSKNLIEIQSSPKVFLKDILDALKKDEFYAENARLKAFSEYCLQNFSEIQEYVSSKSETDRGESNYPDLDLPTYADIYFGSKEILQQAVGSNIEGVNRKLLSTLSWKFTGKQTKEVLRRFLPTYRDLGKRAPLTQDPYDPAKLMSDYVDPDFFYFHERLSSAYDSFAEQVEDEADNLYSPSTNVFKRSHAQAAARQLNDARTKRLINTKQNDENLPQRNIERNDDVTANLDVVPDPEAKPATWFYKGGVWYPTKPKPGFGSDDYHRYTAGDPKLQKYLNKFVHDDPAHMQSLFRETVQSQKDDDSRMLRAFPTFRFQFVEEDNEEYGLWDDFYSYNAIVDIQLSQHKLEPSLLQIRIINATGNLDEARSTIEDPDKYNEDAKWLGPDGSFKDPRPPIGSPDREDYTGEIKQLSRFFLQTGTHVKLSLGYGSGLEDLETVFVGQVVEVRPGDVITILCQSYKSELTVPLNTYKDGSDSDPFDVLTWVMQESPTEHYGVWSPAWVGLMDGQNRAGEEWNYDSFERTGWHGLRRGPRGQSEAAETQMSVYGGVAKGIVSPITKHAGIEDVGSITRVASNAPTDVVNYLVNRAVGLGGIPNYIASLSSDRKMSNVYLPRHSALREAMSWTREFLIPDRSGLEVAHELTRMLPGFVSDTRPYDHRVTLFFGKPEQRYYYTSLKQGEERLWQKFMDRQTKEAKEFDAAFVRLMTGFEGHPYGSTFKLNLRARHSPGKERAKATARLVGSLPGRILGALPLGLIGKDYEKAGERIGRNLFFGYYESPSRVTEMAKVEKYLGSTGLKAAMVYFFNTYASKYGSQTGTVQIAAGFAVAVASTVSGRPRTGLLKQGLRSAFTDEAVAGDQVGTLLASLTDWRGKLDAITGPNDGTSESNNRLRFQTFNMSDDYRAWNFMQDTNAGVVDALGRQIDRERYEKSINAVIDFIPEWKEFIYYLSMYISTKIAEQDTDLLKQVYTNGRILERFEHNPRTKKFRSHHYVDSLRHIIANNITATKEQMANTVVIKYPKDVDYNSGGGRYYVAQDMKWCTMERSADHNIQPSEKKVRLVTEINADDEGPAELALFSNLAEALRPMYRGELILRGDERIKPFDHVWVNDTYENMYGPVEVERVITHFSAETGFTTTVIPQLVAIPASRSSWIDNLACGQVNALKSIINIPGSVSEGLSYAGIGTTGQTVIGIGAATQLVNPVAAPFVLAAAGVGVVGGGLYQGFALKEETGAGIFGNLTGRGLYGAARNPVDIIPLVRNGIPFTAGLRGWGDNNWRLRLFKKWSNIKSGAGLIAKSAGF